METRNDFACWCWSLKRRAQSRSWTVAQVTISAVQNKNQHFHQGTTLGVFTLVTRGWAASEFLTCASKVNMMPNGERQIIGPDRSQTFWRAHQNFVAASPMWKPLLFWVFQLQTGQNKKPAPEYFRDRLFPFWEFRPNVWAWIGHWLKVRFCETNQSDQPWFFTNMSGW